MVTRKDVAERAGVSPAVVSYVLNQSNYVSPEKREAVLKAVKELNYTPNYMARGLKTSRTFHFLLIGDDVRNELYTEIVYHMEKYLYSKGYSISLCSSRTDDEFLNSLLGHHYDGIFLASNRYSTQQINFLAEKNIHMVFFQTRNHMNLDPRIAVVAADYYNGAKQAMQSLFKKGHKRIAYIPPYRFCLKNINIGDYRLMAYKDSLKEFGLIVDQEMICMDATSENKIMQFISSILSSDKAPTAFLIGNDYLAVQIIKYLKNLHLSVPDDIAIIGMDNTMSARNCTPELSTIDVPAKLVACKAADSLIDLNDGKKPESILLPTHLVSREST